MCIKYDRISSTGNKTNKRVGISSVRPKFSLVKIWDPTAAYFRSKGYMTSKFQNGKFENLMADSEFLHKSIQRKCLSFFDIPTKT